MKKIIVAMTMLAVASCGSESNVEQQPAAPEQTAAVATETVSPELPNMMIARVPVDADGNELVDQMTTRVANVDADGFDNTAAEAVFASAQDVTVTNELDADSSTASYHWNTPWYPGKLLGRGTLWGRNPYAYSYGRRYNYRYYGYHNYGRYRYYNYCRW